MRKVKDTGFVKAVRGKAVRVAQALSEDLDRGAYAPGSILPTDQKLADVYGVSRITLRKALSLLARRGRVVKLPQRGVLVPAGEASHAEDVAETESRCANLTQKTMIAAVWAAEPDANVMGISQGIRQYAKEADLHFQLFLSRDGHARSLEVLRNAERYGIDGLMLMPQAMPEYLEALRGLADKGIPVVGVGRLPEDARSSSVDHDNAVGIYQATHYLIEKYHRPPYMLAVEENYMTSIERCIGYRRAMEDAGFGDLVEDHTERVDVMVIDPTYWPMDKKNCAGLSAGRKLLDRAETPLSVVCNNDYIAMGLYQACQERNLRVGRDVRITGFDDLPLAKRLHPSLTTVRQNPVLTGYTGARLLHQLIRGELTPPETIHLPVELIQRESA
ncbi:MAG: substrate-binding domain-containing protein [Phycisphaerae bacterium]|nr:substrate-binding domain-containing protein [Phycisphaerae bacterium]